MSVTYTEAMHTTKDAIRTEYVAVNGRRVAAIDELKAGGFRSWMEGDAELHSNKEQALARICA